MGFFNRDEKRDTNEVIYDPDAKRQSKSEKSGFGDSKGGAPAPPQYTGPVAGPSTLPIDPSAPLHGWASLHLAQNDRIRLVNFPPHINDVVRQTVAMWWPRGLQKEKDQSEWGVASFEFKLKGNPWYAQGVEAVPSKRLMIHLLHDLGAQGWHLAMATDLTKKPYDKDTLIFRAGPPMARPIFAITFNELDKIRLIDAPDDRVHASFTQIVRSWPIGIQEEKMKEQGCYQLKLRGNPWYTSEGQETTHARLLSMKLLAAFDTMGYELLRAIDMNTGNSDGGGDMDAWFFALKAGAGVPHPVA